MSKNKDPWKRGTRIRIKMIARERGLADAEIAAALNCGTTAVVEFADKHDVRACCDQSGLYPQWRM